MSRAKAELIDGMYVVGDLAYLPSEWERMERRRLRRRELSRKNVAAWRARNPERAREVTREYNRRRRHGNYRKLQVTASLHDLRCSGPTKDTGCRCKKQLIVREVEK